MLMHQVEGALTLALAPIAIFWVPNRIDSAWFLNDGEKEDARKRLMDNKAFFNPDEKFS